MKKRLYLITAGLLALGLASCGNQKKDNTTKGEEPIVSTSSNESTSTDDYKLKVSTPNGAPLMAIAGAKDDIDLKLIADTKTLPSIFQANTEDIIVAPINVGAMLYNNNKSKYKLASVVTWGNTYFASAKENFKLEDIKDNKLTLFGKNSINVALAQYVLKQKNITPSEITYPEEDVVASIKTIQEENPDELVMSAEPVLTVTSASLKAKEKTLVSYSISEMYKELTNHKYPQAAVFVNPDTYESHKGKFDEFFNTVKSTCELTSSNPAKAAEVAHNAGVPQPAAVLTKAIPGCAISYVKASDAKADVSYAANLEDIKSFFGGKAPEDAFYLI